jgi:hypothetical protein
VAWCAPRGPETFQRRLQRSLRLVPQGKIKIFGKSVGLEEAFLKARATLEDPALCEFFVRVDASEHPAENVVLLHYMRRERSLRGDAEDFAPIDQSLSPPAPALRNEKTPPRYKPLAVQRGVELRIARCKSVMA